MDLLELLQTSPILELGTQGSDQELSLKNLPGPVNIEGPITDQMKLSSRMLSRLWIRLQLEGKLLEPSLNVSKEWEALTLFPKDTCLR